MSFELDNLASLGIIDFDADAYINGTPPRFIGSPAYPTSFPGVAPGSALAGQPDKDAFTKHEKGEDSNEGNWVSKILIGGALVGTGYILGRATTFCGKVLHIFKKDGAIGKLFNKSIETETPECNADADIEEKVEAKTAETAKKSEGLISKSKAWVSKLSKTAKIAGGIGLGAGVLGLAYEIYHNFKGGAVEADSSKTPKTAQSPQSPQLSQLKQAPMAQHSAVSDKPQAVMPRRSVVSAQPQAPEQVAAKPQAQVQPQANPLPQPQVQVQAQPQPQLKAQVQSQA